jgi:hypothetical protein
MRKERGGQMRAVWQIKTCCKRVSGLIGKFGFLAWHVTDPFVLERQKCALGTPRTRCKTKTSREGENVQRFSLLSCRIGDWTNADVVS